MRIVYAFVLCCFSLTAMEQSKKAKFNKRTSYNKLSKLSDVAEGASLIESQDFLKKCAEKEARDFREAKESIEIDLVLLRPKINEYLSEKNKKQISKDSLNVKEARLIIVAQQKLLEKLKIVTEQQELLLKSGCRILEETKTELVSTRKELLDYQLEYGSK